jgi:hypothetical protein
MGETTQTRGHDSKRVTGKTGSSQGVLTPGFPPGRAASRPPPPPTASASGTHLVTHGLVAQFQGKRGGLGRRVTHTAGLASLQVDSGVGTL